MGVIKSAVNTLIINRIMESVIVSIVFNEIDIENAISDPSSLISNGDALAIKTKEDELQDKLKHSPVTILATMLSRCVEIVELCDPGITKKNTGFISRLIGADLAHKVEYQASVVELSDILDKASIQADAVKSLYSQIDGLIGDLQNKVFSLLKAQSIATYILENRFDEIPENERATFKRRSANLAVMLQATELAIEQFTLNKTNALTIVHRLEEMDSLVLPNWRSLTLQRSLSSELTFEQSDNARNLYATVRRELNEINALLN